MANKRVHSGSESISNYFSKKANGNLCVQESRACHEFTHPIALSHYVIQLRECMRAHMHTPLRLLLPHAVLLEIDPNPPPPPPPSPSLSDLPRYGPGVSFLCFSYLSFLTHADMGKTQDEDIVHAYNLIHSVISDIAIFRENIEKDFHDWFMDASRIGSELGIVLTVPRLSGRQQHRANAGPDPEVYYRINVAIPFLDHMEQVLNYRFHRDSMVGSHLFYLVPT